MRLLLAPGLSAFVILSRQVWAPVLQQKVNTSSCRSSCIDLSLDLHEFRKTFLATICWHMPCKPGACNYVCLPESCAIMLHTISAKNHQRGKATEVPSGTRETGTPATCRSKHLKAECMPAYNILSADVVLAGSCSSWRFGA